MGIIQEKCGFGKRKKTVVSQKKLRRLMVRAEVKKLQKAGKPVDLQAVNKSVLEAARRKR
jgi:hypothetical protein